MGTHIERAQAWKEGEALWCLNLLRTRGNANVSKANVESYLKVQVASAQRDAQMARNANDLSTAHVCEVIASELARAAHYVGQDLWDTAVRSLAFGIGAEKGSA